jgi:hypothetical protein
MHQRGLKQSMLQLKKASEHFPMISMMPDFFIKIL